MKYSIILFCFLFITLIGCTSHTSKPGFGDDFDQKKAAKTRVSLGLTYLKNGNFSQAKFNLDKALEFAPRSADVHYGLAYYYQTVGEISAAENAFQTAMDFAPNNADIANSYGAFLCQQGKYPKAKEYFLKAINNTNYISSAETYENLALCSQSQGFQSEATEYLQNAVNHQPGRAKSLFLLTQSLVIEKKWAEARDALRKYEKVAQISADTLLLSSQIEKELGNLDIAASYGDMLLKIYPASLASKHYKEELLAKMQAPTPVARKSIKVEVPQLADETNRDAPTQEAPSIDAAVAQNEVAPRVESAAIEQAKPTPQTTQPESQSSPNFHIVQAGENLYRISLQYNIKMQRLIEWNGLNNASDIFAGKKLRLVAPDTASLKE
jgi:type IV pilus assembly protein PilF